MVDKKFKTEIVNISSLQKYNFSIPTYQRPYVWADEQLKKLLDDFLKSYRSAEKEYFIGTFLTRENGYKAELIDGQQRFTTMWLISFVINSLAPTSKLSSFLKIDESLRLEFEIRDEVTDYLNFLLNDKVTINRKFDSETINEYPYLKNIARGLSFIKGYFESLEGTDVNIAEFGDYIYENIYLIKNTAPNKTDLNKLFSTINSAGVQLEQTDIIKANLLSLISEKVLYGKVWEACENMNTFFERNVRSTFPNSNFNNLDLSQFNDFDENIFKFENTEREGENSDTFTIDSVDLSSLESYKEPKSNTNEEGREESEEIFCRSIISFGQLLLHTYRLHLKIEGKPDFEGTFHVNRLIEIFKSLEHSSSGEIKRFFKLLWKVRFLFDKYVIKWIADLDTKTESLELLRLNRNEKSYYTRNKYENKTATLMLQSVLYFTGDYLRQYWLTSYLGFLLDNHHNLNANADSLLHNLERIDNSLSLNKSSTDKEASLLLIDEKIEIDFDFPNYLLEAHGTKFQHYWFQKLEYVLWKNWDEPRSSEFENFRIMSRNSVEHVYPQHPDNPIKSPPLDDDILHSFGNLVLLSVAQNSEYSHKSYDEKKGLFKNKNTNTYDTLKSYYIFMKNDSWSTVEILRHRDLMIEKLQMHYQN